MFRPIDFGRLRQHRSAAVPYQLIGRNAKRRVRGDAAVTSGAAAIFSQDQSTDGLGAALQAIRDLQKLGDGSNSGFGRLSHSSCPLNGHELRNRFSGFSLIKLVGLMSEKPEN